VTNSWCLYARPKPHVVWARDALVLADRLGSIRKHRRRTSSPWPFWSLTLGPVALEEEEMRQRERRYIAWPTKPWQHVVAADGFAVGSMAVVSDDCDVHISSNGHFQYPLAAPNQSYITHIIIITTAISAGSARMRGAGALSALACQGPPDAK